MWHPHWIKGIINKGETYVEKCLSCKINAAAVMWLWTHKIGLEFESHFNNKLKQFWASDSPKLYNIRRKGWYQASRTRVVRLFKQCGHYSCRIITPQISVNLPFKNKLSLIASNDFILKWMDNSTKRRETHMYLHINIYSAESDTRNLKRENLCCIIHLMGV